MRATVRALVSLLFCLGSSAAFSQTQPPQPDKNANSALIAAFSDFDLPAAAEKAEQRLRHAPHDVTALFVRMEAAEVQERPEVVLDSALKLCSLHASPALHELASNRILQHAGNTWAFNLVLRRIKLAAWGDNDCTFNLRLALVSAAMDGARVDLDQAAHSAGLLTRWRIAGPFGKYNNVDFERH